MNAGKFTTGLVLLIVGILSFCETLDVYDTRNLWQFWPVILIAIGLSNEIDALRARKSDGSFILLGIGAWMLVGTRHYFGLSVSNAMPVGIMVVGMAILLHAIVDRPEVLQQQENAHEQQ